MEIAKVILAVVWAIFMVEVFFSPGLRLTRSYRWPLFSFVGLVSGIGIIWLASMIATMRFEQDWGMPIDFTSSTSLSLRQKEVIRLDLSAFRRYLILLGFDVPKRMPIIDADPESANGSALVGEEFFEHKINLGKNALNDPLSARFAYANYVFVTLLDAHNLNRPDFLNRTQEAMLLGSYFVYSYSEQAPRTPVRWIGALWTLREALRVDGLNLDKALWYAFMISQGAERQRDFDEYFYTRFIYGESLVDSRFQHSALVDSVLKEYGVMLP